MVTMMAAAFAAAAAVFAAGTFWRLEKLSEQLGRRQPPEELPEVSRELTPARIMAEWFFGGDA